MYIYIYIYIHVDFVFTYCLLLSRYLHSTLTNLNLLNLLKT